MLPDRGSWVRNPVWQHTFVSPSAFLRRAVVSYWRKYVHEVLVNRLGGLSLPRKSVVRLTDRPDMFTVDVKQQCNNNNKYLPDNLDKYLVLCRVEENVHDLSNWSQFDCILHKTE